MSAVSTCRPPGGELARLVGVDTLGPDLVELWLEAPLAARAEPGQFIHLKVGDGYLRRPFSLYRTVGDRVSLLIRVKGRGTRWLAGLAAGAELDVLGPLGCGFAAPVAGDRLLLIGGGVGLAPLVTYAQRHAVSHAIVGYRAANQVVGVAPLQDAGVAVDLVTEDGSAGRAGRVTDGLAERLVTLAPTRVLCCGPDAMMRAVADVCQAAGIPLEVSLERPMGCGIGLCLGCVAPLAAGGFTRTCVEGPVFQAETLAW